MSADCEQICYVFRDQVAMYITLATCGVHLHVRTRRHAPFFIYRNSWTDCTDIRYVDRDPLARRFAKAKDGLHLHVRTCGPFSRISGTTGCITLKFDLWLGGH